MSSPSVGAGTGLPVRGRASGGRYTQGPHYPHEARSGAALGGCHHTLGVGCGCLWSRPPAYSGPEYSRIFRPISNKSGTRNSIRGPLSQSLHLVSIIDIGYCFIGLCGTVCNVLQESRTGHSGIRKWACFCAGGTFFLHARMLFRPCTWPP